MGRLQSLAENFGIEYAQQREIEVAYAPHDHYCP